MLNFYKYTDKEKDELVSSMIILVDTREKQTHIMESFDQYKINYQRKALDYGDYSFMIPKNETLNIPRDIYFDKLVCIERKGSLEELSGNLTKERDRLEKELCLAPKTKVLLIENANYSDVVDGKYNTQYNRKSFLGSLHSFGSNITSLLCSCRIINTQRYSLKNTLNIILRITFDKENNNYDKRAKAKNIRAYQQKL